MPSYVAKPFEVNAQQWWPDLVVEGVYEMDRHAPRGIRGSKKHPAGQCGWTIAHGLVLLVEPGDMIVDMAIGRFVCKPEIFDRAFSPVLQPALRAAI